jgi:hypothetical protein
MKYPKMTRCHFQFIADIIRETAEGQLMVVTQSEIDGPSPYVHDPTRGKATAEAFANQLYGTNNNFDRGRFMAACEPKVDHQGDAIPNVFGSWNYKEDK